MTEYPENMNHVVFIGPDNRDHRGGIGAVLDVYSKHIRPFRLIPTFVTKPFPIQFVTYVSAVLKLIWLCLTDRSVKVLHIHHASKGSFLRKSIMVLIGKLFRKKIILHIHGAKFHLFYQNSKLLKPYIKYILESADVVICLSESWRQFFSSNFKLKQLEIINNVIEEAAQQPRNGHSPRVNLLFLGQIGNRKGVFDLLEVLASNKNDFKNRVHVTIGGIGEVERLQKTIKEKEFNGDVTFAGWVKGTKKAELLNDCDVYILPSYNEGLPISVLEAMSYGKPVISTNVGGIPEIVKPGYNGWLFQPGDHEALTTIIKEVLDNRDKLQEYGNNSLLITRDYTPGSVVRSLEKLYAKMNIA